MNLRASVLSRLPWRLTRNDAPVESHPLIGLLTEFGPETNWADAFGGTELDMLQKGAAYWLKDGDRLARLNPNTMKVKRTASGIQGFTQVLFVDSERIERTFAREDVVYFRTYHPTDDLGPGIAAMDVAKKAILAEYEAERYIKAFFENDALPGLLMHTEQTIPSNMLKELKAWWDATFKGAKKAHKVGWVDKGLEAQILSSDLRSMALEEVRRQARKSICESFEVPEVLIGGMLETTFANAAEARLFFTQEVVIPRADRYADTINAEFVSAIDPSVVFEFATDEMEILQEDKDAKAQRLISLKNAGIVDAAYVREELGIDEDAAPEEEPALVDEDGATALRNWRTKALKALKLGKSADVPFETKDIPPALQAAIHVRLAQAKTPEEVAHVLR